MRSVKLTTGFSIAVLTASSVLSVAAAGERELAQATYSLQYDFGTASDLVVEPRWQSAPEDVSAILKHISAHLVVGKPTFANIGEEWATTDAVSIDLPQAQHLFSAYSGKVAASVFLVGGSEVKVFAVLARRHGYPGAFVFSHAATLVRMRLAAYHPCSSLTLVGSDPRMWKPLRYVGASGEK